MAVWKIAPPLAAGICIILKPAEQIPILIMVPKDLIGAYIHSKAEAHNGNEAQSTPSPSVVSCSSDLCRSRRLSYDCLGSGLIQHMAVA